MFLMMSTDISNYNKRKWYRDNRSVKLYIFLHSFFSGFSVRWIMYRGRSSYWRHHWSGHRHCGVLVWKLEMRW